MNVDRASRLIGFGLVYLAAPFAVLAGWHLDFWRAAEAVGVQAVGVAILGVRATDRFMYWAARRRARPRLSRAA